jgi:uncharacterized membrane protein
MGTVKTINKIVTPIMVIAMFRIFSIESELAMAFDIANELLGALFFAKFKLFLLDSLLLPLQISLTFAAEVVLFSFRLSRLFVSTNGDVCKLAHVCLLGIWSWFSSLFSFILLTFLYKLRLVEKTRFINAVLQMIMIIKGTNENTNESIQL